MDYKYALGQCLDLITEMNQKARAYEDMNQFFNSLRSKWKHGDYGEEATKVIDELYEEFCSVYNLEL